MNVSSCFHAAARNFREVVACIMQVSPVSEEKEVPGKDRWKFFHIVELVVVSGSSLETLLNATQFHSRCSLGAKELASQ